MVLLIETIKIGNVYYLATDVQKIMEVRIKRISPEEISDLE